MATSILSDTSAYALRPADPTLINEMCEALVDDLESSAPESTRDREGTCHFVWRGGTCQPCLWECMLSGSAGRHGRAVVQALGAAVRPPRISVGHPRSPPEEAGSSQASRSSRHPSEG